MGHISRIRQILLDYPRRYPKTLAIRGAALVCLAGYFLVFPAAKPMAVVVAISVVSSYVLTKICRFFGVEFRGHGRIDVLCRMICHGPYAVFEIIWNLLSAPSEVDEL